MANNQTNKSTDYTLDEMTLVSASGLELDISRIFMNLNIYEDIFSNFITGNVQINDSSNLFDNLPIYGEETLKIRFRSAYNTDNEYSFSHEFDVFAVSNIEQQKINMKTYTLQFASKEYKKNLQTKLSKAFMGKTEEIASTILKDSLGYSGDIFTDVSMYDQHLIVPYWRPADTINWLSSKTILASNTSASNFLFFESSLGYHFQSLETLYSSDPIADFVYNQSGVEAETRFDSNRIFNFRIEDTLNTFENITSGLYGNTLVTHDMYRKTISTQEFDYQTNFDAREKTDKHPILNDNNTGSFSPSNKRIYYTKQTDNFSDQILNNNRSDKWLQNHMVQIKESGLIKIVAEVAGNTRTYAGAMCNFNLKMQNPEKPEQVVANKYFSGGYLITAVHHAISKSRYVQVLEMCKNSLPTTLNKGL